MRYEWLSYNLDISGPRPPAIPAPNLEEYLYIDKDEASVQKLTVYSHTGTHLDTSAHVYENGVHITEFKPVELIFNKPEIIDITLNDDAVVTPEILDKYMQENDKTEILLLRFGLSSLRENDAVRYALHSPGLSIDAGGFILGKMPNLRALGMDAPSAASIPYIKETMGVHNKLLSGFNMRFIIIEEMKLDLYLNGLEQIIINPWMVKGMHSGPCTVTGVFEV